MRLKFWKKEKKLREQTEPLITKKDTKIEAFTVLRKLSARIRGDEVKLFATQKGLESIPDALIRSKNKDGTVIINNDFFNLFLLEGIKELYQRIDVLEKEKCK
jgi:hypothetical protein